MKRCLFLVLFFVFTSCNVFAVQGDLDLDEAQILFKHGLAEKEKGNLYSAIDDFYNILSSQPQLQKVRLEMAVTYYKLYRFEEAKKQAKLVLGDPKTPTSVKIAVLSFLEKLEENEASFSVKHVWSSNVNVGWLYDSNVNAGPGSEILEIGLGRLYLSPGSGETSDTAVVLGAGVSHIYQSGKTFRTGERTTHFFWQSNGQYYRKDYFSEHDYDLDVVSLATGPFLLNIGNWRFGLPVQFDHIRMGNATLADFISMNPNLSKQFPALGMELGLSGQIVDRNYKRKIDFNRDSDYYSGKVVVSKVFKTTNIALSVGCSWFTEKADANRYSNDGRDAFMGATWAFVQGSSLCGRFNEKHTDYDGLVPIFGERYDREEKITVGIAYKFQQEVLKRYSVKVDFVRNENRSSAELYTYDREQLTISLAGRF